MPTSSTDDHAVEQRRRARCAHQRGEASRACRSTGSSAAAGASAASAARASGKASSRQIRARTGRRVASTSQRQHRAPRPRSRAPSPVTRVEVLARAWPRRGHQRRQPRVLELLGAPDARRGRRRGRARALRRSTATRVHVEQRAVRVEDEGGEGWGIGGRRRSRDRASRSLARPPPKKRGYTLRVTPWFMWWALLGSNQRPLPCEGSALPLS